MTKPFFRAVGRVYVAIAALLGSAVSAQDTSDPGMTVGFGGSSLGGTLQAQIPMSQTVFVRGIWATGAGGDGARNDTGFTYNYDLNLGGAAVVLDYYPSAKGFRASAGLFKSNSGAQIVANIDGDRVGSTVYSNGQITGDIRFRHETAPMLGLGYDFARGNRFAFGAEIGGIFIGGLDAIGRSTGATTINQTDIDAEINDIKNEVGDLQIYPYISLMANFRF